MRVRPRNWSMGGVHSVNAAFRSAIGISLLFHAVAFGSVWHAMGSHPPTAKPHAVRDVWAGTTVNVDTEPTRASAPSSPQRLNVAESPEAQGSTPEQAVPAHVKNPSLTSRAAPKVDEATGKSRDREVVNPSKTNEPSEPSSQASKASSSAGVDLKQGMLDASNQKQASAGTFGVVGVDLFRERRLPRALTRAMPQAISGEPKWWGHPVGTLGRVVFEVMLDEAGKIQEVRLDDASSHALLARIVRRAGRILSINHFALVEGAANSWQRFELRLDSEQVTPASDDGGEAGDTFSMGYEAPTAQEPGRAHIQDARGRRMRATVRVLAPARPSPAAPSETATSPE